MHFLNIMKAKVINYEYAIVLQRKMFLFFSKLEEVSIPNRKLIKLQIFVIIQKCVLQIPQKQRSICLKFLVVKHIDVFEYVAS